MKLNLITENQVKIIVERQMKKQNKQFWKELNKLRSTLTAFLSNE